MLIRVDPRMLRSQDLSLESLKEGVLFGTELSLKSGIGCQELSGLGRYTPWSGNTFQGGTSHWTRRLGAPNSQAEAKADVPVGRQALHV